MKQYIELLKAIRENGSQKGEARDNMPTTLSLFGYQFRHNLADGFPLLTTKKMGFKGVVIELLWFLKGDTNIKFLDENGVDFMWHQDAYQYYIKLCQQQNILSPFSFGLFCSIIRQAKDIEELKQESIKNSSFQEHSRNVIPKNYTLGDCGKQYGWLWRNWEGSEYPEVLSVNTQFLSREELDDFGKKWSEIMSNSSSKPVIIDSTLEPKYLTRKVDQIKDLIEGLKKSPFGRRHIITAWNPTTLQDMALNACHCFVQFNCRSLTLKERSEYADKRNIKGTEGELYLEHGEYFDRLNIPKYYLDCQLYQRSADVILGVPFNIASYALLTEILAKICNMVPGDFVHTFGDVHIYSNHVEAVEEQLQREPKELPKLIIEDSFLEDLGEVLNFSNIGMVNFDLVNYNPHPKLKSETELSTGLKK